MPTTFLHFLEDGQWVRYSGIFNQIVTKAKTQIPVPRLSFDGDPSYTFRREDLFVSCVDNCHQNGRNLNEPLNMVRHVHMTVPISDPLHLAKNFHSRLLKYALMMPTTNGVRSVNLTLMK
jgi:hypothetical protein